MFGEVWGCEYSLVITKLKMEKNCVQDLDSTFVYIANSLWIPKSLKLNGRVNYLRATKVNILEH